MDGCKPADPVAPHDPDLDTISEVWERVTYPRGIFAIHRSEAYLRWRYVDSPAFQYHFFGDPLSSGTIVARLEQICTREHISLDGANVLRIIEILPANDQAWSGKTDRDLHALIGGVLSWATREGCLMADFYCGSPRFGSLMKELGFRGQTASFGPDICSVPIWFQPLSYGGTPINAFFRLSVPDRQSQIPFGDTYIVKSENDQDRPNLLGREGSWVY